MQITKLELKEMIKSAVNEALTDINKENSDLKENFESSLPVQVLSEGEITTFIDNIPEPAQGRPPRFFKVGYTKELKSEIASKFRGGRGSEESPSVRIIKCVEYSAAYTGSPYSATKGTKEADKILGADRHTGERTGFSFEGPGCIENKIGIYTSTGDLALQIYLNSQSKQKAKYFISLNDEDLKKASNEDVAQYLTPAAASKLTGGFEKRAAGEDSEGNKVYGQNIQRLKLKGIYLLGSLGKSVI